MREERVAGRAAVVLRTTPRPGADNWRWWGFLGPADPIEVAIDLERGVALGAPYYQVDEIAFDEELHPEVFSRPWPDDLRRVHHGRDLPRAVSLEEARLAVAFPVLLPGVLPEGARLLRCVVDPMEPPEWVGMSWAFDPGHRFVLNLRQGPGVARERARMGGEEITRGGARLLVESIGQERPLPTRCSWSGARRGWRPTPTCRWTRSSRSCSRSGRASGHERAG